MSNWINTALLVSITAALVLLYRKVDLAMAEFDEVRAEYKAYAAGQKERADVAEAALAGASERADSAVAALEAFQADDAATDAAQLVTQAQELAAGLRADLDEIRGVVVPPEPTDPPVDPETPAE